MDHGHHAASAKVTTAPHTGTTIVACRYPGGVVAGADGRVSTGQYISNRSSNKITPLADNVFLLRSGSAADTELVSDYVRYYVNQHSADTGDDPSVRLVANMVMQLNYSNKEMLVGAMLVAGYDAAKGGQVFGCPIGGTLVEEPWAIDGSGSSYIWSHCDTEYRSDFTREEAEAFVREAVALAINRDGSSGGCIRLVTITAQGAFHHYTAGDKVKAFQEEIFQVPAESMAE